MRRQLGARCRSASPAALQRWEDGADDDGEKLVAEAMQQRLLGRVHTPTRT